MACEIKINDIQREVKNTLVNELVLERARAEGDKVFVPFSVSNQMYLSNTVAEVNKKIEEAYNASKHGNMLSVDKNDNGITITINPAQSLADDMTAQAYARELGDDFFLGDEALMEQELYSSRHEGTEENALEPEEKPLGDNYGEFIKYKESQLEIIEARKQRLKSNLNYKDTSADRAKLKELEKLERTIQNQLEILADNKVDHMFHAIINDLIALEKAIDAFDIHNIQEVKDKLDFYDALLKTLIDYNHEDFHVISGNLVKLREKYDKSIVKKVLDHLEQSELVQQLISNVNEGKGDSEQITIEDLLIANSDLSKADSLFLGLISSTTSDTILPQFLMTEFRNKLFQKQNRAINLIDRLNDFTKTSKMTDFDWVFSKAEDGTYDGNLVDLYSDKWYDAWKDRNRRINEFFSSMSDPEMSTKTAYNKLVNWYKDNTNVIDFTRLSIVKDLYGEQYKEHFTYDDTSIKAYEDNLKKQLGPKYDEVIEQVLNKLQKFEELKEETGEYVERNVASHDVWEFLKQYKKGTPGQMSYEYKEMSNTPGDLSTVTKQGHVYFSGFKDLPILPKSTVRKAVPTNVGMTIEEQDSGYYSPEFQDVIASPEKLEYWSILRQMSQYINSTYNLDEQGKLPYPKIQADYAERLLEDFKSLRANKKVFGKLGNMFHDSLHEYKSFFYEKGRNPEGTDIVSNYSDTSKAEINRLMKIHMLRGADRDVAKQVATLQVLKHYSSDINKNFKAMVVEAALHDTRLEVAPMAQGILEVYKNIRDGKGELREQGIKRLEHYVDKVIFNKTVKQRGTNETTAKDLSKESWLAEINKQLGKVSKGLTTEERMRLLSDIDKQYVLALKQVQKEGFPAQSSFTITDLGFDMSKHVDDETKENVYMVNGEVVDYETIQKEFQDYVAAKIDSVGLDLSMAGILEGVMKVTILKSLGLNPISGIFNRIEGKHSAMIMDLTGEYWTEGNIDKANEMMAWANLTKMLPDKLKSNIRGKRTQIEIFEKLLTRLGTLQDRKNELQKNVDDSKFNTEMLNVFKMAVERPEFKNQGAITLAVMMDMDITDNQGNTHKLLDRNTGKFTPFEIVGNNLEIKPEFKDSFSFESEDFSNLVLKVEDAVSHSQGNYNQYDIMRAKKGLWGKAATMFMGWFPEHLNQRWGLRGDGNYNLVTGKERQEGRYVAAYQASKVNFVTYFLAALGLSYGALGMAGLAGAGVLGAIVYTKYLRKIASDAPIRQEASIIKDVASFIASTLIETLNYPSRIGSSIPGLNKLRIENKMFKGGNLSAKEAGALRAMTRELAMMMSALGVKLAIGMLMYDDDDDKDSPQRKRFNFLQNQMTRIITSLNSFTDAHSLLTDYQRIACLQTTLDAISLMYDIIGLNEESDDKLEKTMGLVGVPKLITKQAFKGEKPWEDKKDVTTFRDPVSKFDAPLAWVNKWYKDQETEGEYSAQKDYDKIRTEKREEIKQELLEKYGDNKKVLEKILRIRMKQEVGSKDKTKDYKETLEDIQDDGKLSPSSKKKGKARKVDRTKYKKKLKEDGFTNEEIRQIMAEEFRGR